MMKINEINYCNIDKVLKVISSGKNNQNYKKQNSENITNVLNHASISMDINEISIIEAFMLKQFASDSIFTFETNIDNSLIDKEKYPEYKEISENIFDLTNTMNNDEDIEYKPTAVLFPSVCLTKHVLVIFTGDRLHNIFSSVPDLFFDEMFSKLHIENDRKSYPTELPSKEILDNTVIEWFYKHFYKFINNKLSNINLFTDVTIKEEYYDVNDNNGVFMSHVNTPYGIINFVNSNALQIQNELSKASRIFTLDESIIEEAFKNTIIYFEVKSTFYTFLEMFMKLPTKFFSDYEDIKILLKDNEIIIPDGYDQYTVRLNTIIEKLILFRDNFTKENNNGVEKFNYILLNTPIKYTLQLSLDDIRSTLYNYEKEVKEKNIYGDNTFIQNEISSIIEIVNNNARIIYGSLIK